MGLSLTEMFFTIPFSIYFLVNNLRNPQYPWVSWEDTHQNLSYVQYWPMILIETFPQVVMGLNINLWVTPLGGLSFFLWFGMPSEAGVEYMRVFGAFVQPFRMKSKPTVEQSTGTWYVHGYTSMRLAVFLRDGNLLLR